MAKVKKAYDEVSIVRIVSNNRGCNISGKTITVDDTKQSVGNSTWGKIDYLCNYHGYNYTIGKVEKHFTKGASKHPKVREVKDSKYGKKNIGGIVIGGINLAS